MRARTILVLDQQDPSFCILYWPRRRTIPRNREQSIATTLPRRLKKTARYTKSSKNDLRFCSGFVQNIQKHLRLKFIDFDERCSLQTPRSPPRSKVSRTYLQRKTENSSRTKRMHTFQWHRVEMRWDVDHPKTLSSKQPGALTMTCSMIPPVARERLSLV